MAFDPVIQRYMTHFYDVQGNLHITIKPDLTKALGWADPKERNGELYMESSMPVCLDIEYSGEIGDFNSDCDVVIRTKAKAQGVEDSDSQPESS
jgi:hypothetical protein